MALNESAKMRKVKPQGKPVATPVSTPSAKPTKVDNAEIVLETLGNTYEGNPELGSLSDKLEYVAALGDPSVPDPVELKKADGSIEKHVFSRIIGYRFKALEAMSVPDFGTTSRFNGDRLMNAEDPNRWKNVQAGETFDLTRLEAGALLSKAEFAGKADAGENPVKMTVAFGKLKTANGVNVEDAEQMPVVQLVLQDGTKSIKKLGIIDVLDYVSNSTAENRYAEGTRTMRPEFENTKWANRALAASKRASAPRSQSSNKDARVIKVSAAFNALMGNLAQNANRGL